jgi:hypothetical protein
MQTFARAGCLLCISSEGMRHTHIYTASAREREHLFANGVTIYSPHQHNERINISTHTLSRAEPERERFGESIPFRPLHAAAGVENTRQGIISKNYSILPRI